MPVRDLLLALIVAIVWGLNFVVIRIALDGVPPLLLGALRFLFVAIPAVFLVRRPATPWGWLTLYGLTISFGQFAFLFLGMHLGMPAGLASLVLQAQALLTPLFASIFLQERLRTHNLLGLLMAGAGLALIGVLGGQSTTLIGFLLTLVAAASWALGNIVIRRIGRVDPIALVIWAGLVPTLPFFLMSWLFEGPQRMLDALTHLSLASALAIAYQTFVATMLGYAIWSRLLARHPAGLVAPFALLVPVVGLTAAAIVFGERLSPALIAGACLVLIGLAVNVFGQRLGR